MSKDEEIAGLRDRLAHAEGRLAETRFRMVAAEKKLAAIAPIIERARGLDEAIKMSDTVQFIPPESRPRGGFHYGGVPASDLPRSVGARTYAIELLQAIRDVLSPQKIDE
jgi:molybdopterin converting factor small subunit